MAPTDVSFRRGDVELVGHLYLPDFPPSTSAAALLLPVAFLSIARPDAQRPNEAHQPRLRRGH
jgi:hypothetical protein